MHEEQDRIKDYMIPFSDYPSVSQKMTLEEAVNLIHRMVKDKGYRWLLVLDGNNNITGFLTLRSIFEAMSTLAPKAGGWLGIFTYNRPGMFYWEGIRSIRDTPLEKLIKPLVDVHVQETDPPSKAAELILNRRITIVPVMDDRNKIVGIVRPVDLLPFIKKLFESVPQG